MNAEEMIESVLSGMEGQRLEQALHGDKEQLIRFEKLRVALDRLLDDDGSGFEHPPDLASRTVSFVARNRRRPLTLLEQVSTRLPFRWADFAVAASIFGAAGVPHFAAGVSSTAGETPMNQAGCVTFNRAAASGSSDWFQYATLQRPPSLPYFRLHRSAHACRNVRGDAARYRRPERHVRA